MRVTLHNYEFNGLASFVLNSKIGFSIQSAKRERSDILFGMYCMWEDSAINAYVLEE